MFPIAVAGSTEAARRRNVGYSFVAFGAFVAASVVFIAAYVPETHKLTLEQIQDSWRVGRRGGGAAAGDAADKKRAAEEGAGGGGQVGGAETRGGGAVAPFG